mmetsp:Transcript_5426/g.22209  ORF Transcript_5426/g.22209 Transcript_5426/m.22209 type:complete len:240 (-) Transcript_5426:2591-3310(-)
MARAATSGGNLAWISGYNAPAAIGTPRQLYASEKNRLIRIRLNVTRDISSAATTSSRLDRTSTTPAASIATSVPAPTAIPRSDWAIAGASLMPSPTTATLFPSCCRSLTASTFPAGRASATTCLMPTDAAIARATLQLSPDTSEVPTPRPVSAATAADASGLTGSLTHTRPSGLPPWATPACTTATVCPFSSSSRTASSIAGVMSTPFSDMNLTLPTKTDDPSSTRRHRKPRPATASKS